MSRELKVGDLIRIRGENGVKGYRPGDRGQVLFRASSPTLDGKRFYTVAMDKDDMAPEWIVFTEDEIEPDV
jgi:hypothetical protein